MPLNFDAVNAAIAKIVDDALAQDATADEAQIAAIRAAAQQQIQDTLAADAVQDAIVLKAKDDQIAALKARIAELEAGPGPVDPPPVDPPPVEPPPPPPVAGDGSANASGGAPQVPNLLSGYRFRPAWRVAGVDYAVGVRQGVTLKKPTANNLPAGAELGPSVVYIKGNNVTLSGFDLSGFTVMIADDATGTARIVDCAAKSVNIRSVANPTPKAALEVRYCTLDANGGYSDFNMIKQWVPKLTVEYCVIKNGAAGIQCGGSLAVRYNLMSGFAWISGAHANAISVQPSNGAIIEYNTIYCGESRNAQGFPIGIGTGIALYTDFGGNHTNPLVANNVVIANFNGGGSYLTGAYIRDPAKSRVTGMVVRDNWYDSTGAFGPLYKAPGNVQATYTNNRDLKSGQVVG